jgi:hypothetical protein
LVAGLVGGVVCTSARRHGSSPWLWGGVALALLICAPHLVWQVQHSFISLEFLRSIHARDVAIGRTQGYLIEQFLVATNPCSVPLWVAGLYYYCWTPAGVRYRMLGWMYVIPFVLFLVMQGRSYYLAPAYPMLIAAGVIVWEQWLPSLPAATARLVRRVRWGALAAGGLLFGAVMLPVASVNSGLWGLTSQLHDNFVEEIGWPELAETVAAIYHTLPADARPRTAILTGNAGEAGAINLYGPTYGLPKALSGSNSYWLRGYSDPPPETLIVVGFARASAERYFTTCGLAGHVTNRYGVENEETTVHPDIFVCRGPRQPWPALWEKLQRFS